MVTAGGVQQVTTTSFGMDLVQEVARLLGSARLGEHTIHQAWHRVEAVTVGPTLVPAGGWPPPPGLGGGPAVVCTTGWMLPSALKYIRSTATERRKLPPPGALALW